MITNGMKDLLSRLHDLCYKASEEIYENEETKEILEICDKLQMLIDEYLKI